MENIEHNNLHKPKGENFIIENFITLNVRRMLKGGSYKEKRDRVRIIYFEPIDNKCVIF